MASLNWRARRRALEQAADLMALALELQDEYAASGEIIIALVYRMEAADQRLDRAMKQAWPHDPARPAHDRHHMATALHEVVHLAQLSREWRQDAVNLRHALLACVWDGDAPEDPGLTERRAALEAGVAQLNAYVRQNMHDLDRWMKAAEKLAPSVAQRAGALRDERC